MPVPACYVPANVWVAGCARQVHATGIDIRQAADVVAAITLSKDTTLRDNAQVLGRRWRGGGGKDTEEEDNGKARKGERGGRGRVDDRVVAPICVCARQGAYCIRGIGRGQRLSLLMMPEVRCAIRGELAAPVAPAAPARPHARSWWALRPG